MKRITFDLDLDVDDVESERDDDSEVETRPQANRARVPHAPRASSVGAGSMRSLTPTPAERRTRERPDPTMRAPALRRVVDAMMSLRHNPQDRKAKIQLALLDKEGACDCPSCGVALELTGYRVTKTEYCERETLRCTGCRATFLIEETHVV